MRFALLAVAAVVNLATSFGCSPPSPPASSRVAAAKNLGNDVEAADLRPRVDVFCGNCHIVPDPSTFPKSAWHEEVRRGFEFYAESGRSDLSPPALVQVADFYRQLAPDELVLSRPDSVGGDAPGIEFRSQEIVSQSDRTRPASISFIDWSTSQKPGAFWLSDMEHGTVVRQTLDGAITWRQSKLCAHPVAIRICDLDNNGESDLLATDLGSFQPADHDRGRVIWVPGFERESPEHIPVLENVGRVADVRVGDFDADGRVDLVVAEFGWHRTGGIHVLFNREDTNAKGGIRFEKMTVDDRAGAIQVPAADLNGDGRLDFVALISQEHEVVVAFLNEPEGFRKVTLGVPNDPSNGFSGLELTDLDADGDLDVLTTNGDTFDSHLIKPYHGVAWLENEGNLQFREHRLTSLPGVHRALAADLDGDGDLDIAAAALLPKQLLRGQDPSGFDSVIWLEQTSRGVFRRHSIERGSPTHAAMVLGDFDFDSDIDIAVGQFGNEQIPPGGAMTILWNDGPARTVSR